VKSKNSLSPPVWVLILKVLGNSSEGTDASLKALDGMTPMLKVVVRFV
jgi:hypothetical protein